ncbi:MAG: hypothetical protein P8L85_12400 [Rubripirellula sp.]|nr:hypothetical protein [Rubripirellula sp.]
MTLVKAVGMVIVQHNFPESRLRWFDAQYVTREEPGEKRAFGLSVTSSSGDQREYPLASTSVEPPFFPQRSICRGRYTLCPGSPLHLDYRIQLHEGPAEVDQIRRAQAAFAR